MNLEFRIDEYKLRSLSSKSQYNRQGPQKFNMNENHDIAIAMSFSRADPVLGLNILQG